MIKVICIEGAKPGHIPLTGTALIPGEDIVEGQIYTAFQSMRFSDSYRLDEKPSNVSYVKSRFIPLSEIDETEMVRESLTEKV